MPPALICTYHNVTIRICITQHYTLILMEHNITKHYSITASVYCHINMYRRSSAWCMYAWIYTCTYVCTYIGTRMKYSCVHKHTHNANALHDTHHYDNSLTIQISSVEHFEWSWWTLLYRLHKVTCYKQSYHSRIHLLLKLSPRSNDVRNMH